MAPIYDTDVAEERWSKAEWEHYELWEQVEARLRRNKRQWVVGTALLFLALSSIPILMDRWPKWTTLTAARKLGQEINWMKRQAGIDHAAYQIHFGDANGALTYVIEKKESCSDAHAGKPAKEGTLLSEKKLPYFRILDTHMGDESGIPGLVTRFCYDYLSGSDALLRNESLVGFAIAPVKDLTDKARVDRFSLLLLNGPSAEISFE